MDAPNLRRKTASVAALQALSEISLRNSMIVLLCCSTFTGVLLQHARLEKHPVRDLIVHRPPSFGATRSSAPLMSAQDENTRLPFIFDIGTKGGIIFYSILGTVLPFVAYSVMTGPMGIDIVTAGNVVLVSYVGLGTVAWTGRPDVAENELVHTY